MPVAVLSPLGEGREGGRSRYNFTMGDREKNDILRRVEAWRVASKVLDEERSARLRSMTDDECRRIIADIFSVPMPPYRERQSGLVEQQRLFKKLRRSSR
jgi:hypothetical protein